jgi:hypothetical protein
MRQPLLVGSAQVLVCVRAGQEYTRVFNKTDRILRLNGAHGADTC